MKDLDVTQVFCEVLTGLAFFFVILSVLSLTGSHAVHDVALYAASKLTIASLGAILVIAYLVGTMMDAVGLALDQLFLYRLVARDEPSEEERAKFWKNVNQHVLAYREAQWTYFSCYRNLFILFVPGSILWTLIVWNNIGPYWGISTGFVFLLLEASFFVTMKALVEIYFKITKSL
jgi:hypothetical protein